MQQTKQNSQSGMALITVLIFSVVAIIVITLGVTLMIIQSGSSTTTLNAQEALFVAESGMENALIRLLRDPGYTGETLTFDNGTATITVTGTTNKTVTVTSDVFDIQRQIQVQVTEVNGVTTVNSWEEVP